ncbi:MAG: aspartate--tRNA ligase [Rickettsiales bacterium]|nr:aspartate--tRNA ligase [Rickettsiales bacterium]
MNTFRTHNCGDLTVTDINSEVKISGWLNKKRDHGGLLFLDIRDFYGITQCVIDCEHENFHEIEGIKLESVVSVSGKVVERKEDTINKNISTGQIEIKVDKIDILNESEIIPFQVAVQDDAPEELRLKYRYLDLRRKNMRDNLILRSEIISFLRDRMRGEGFFEIQTPILSASSPEGARDFVVPSRLHAGKFYALPQAPQIFKQLLMVSGVDKYFQIAPCFRDEDARADRSPGEFYQLDFEMAFVEQSDIFKTIEPILFDLFNKFSSNMEVSKVPFEIIPYAKAISEFGTDKPDLRNPLRVVDISDCFENSGFKIFEENLKKGQVVKGIVVKNSSDRPRSWFDKMNNWAREQGQKGLGYIIYENDSAKGPIANNLKDENFKMIRDKIVINNGDSIFFISDKINEANLFASKVRDKLCEEFKLRKQNSFEFCWIVDYPMYEINKETNKIDFSHNPFSMPQGGMDSLINKAPLDILAWQFDIVCNGIELSSGAIRNHKNEIMVKAFEIAGYDTHKLREQFGGLFEAFKFGAPPHGGSAPGIDRIVMLLADVINLREIVAFPLNQQADDLLLGAPNYIDNKHLKELNIKTIDWEKNEVK